MIPPNQAFLFQLAQVAAQRCCRRSYAINQSLDAHSTRILQFTHDTGVSLVNPMLIPRENLVRLAQSRAGSLIPFALQSD